MQFGINLVHKICGSNICRESCECWMLNKLRLNLNVVNIVNVEYETKFRELARFPYISAWWLTSVARVLFTELKSCAAPAKLLRVKVPLPDDRHMNGNFALKEHWGDTIEGEWLLSYYYQSSPWSSYLYWRFQWYTSTFSFECDCTPF